MCSGRTPGFISALQQNVGLERRHMLVKPANGGAIQRHQLLIDINAKRPAIQLEERGFDAHALQTPERPERVVVKPERF